ncbi:MAG: hypothetical protein ABSC93_15505 [Bryobacteraceae bacterium]|jgi:hypothetical protein
MTRTACIVIVCAAFPLLAETRLDVSQLAAAIASGLAVDRNDNRMARSLKPVRLTERLTAKTAAQLVQLGVGPDTARALDALAKQSARLRRPARETLSFTPAPSASDQDEMIAKVRRYVADYLAHFPDFIATEVAQQYHNWALTAVNPAVIVNDAWHPAGEYKYETAYVSGHAYQKPTAVASETKGRLLPVSNGEFGGMMEEIFNAGRAATFAWDRWQMRNGTRLAVLAYNVPLATSGYTVCCRQIGRFFGKPQHESVKAGHRGFVLADPRSGAVMRLIMYATDFADEADTLAAGHVLDYGEVTIGARRYLVPSHSSAYVRIGRYESRDEIEYRNYRKFSSEAAINFAEDAGDRRK